MAAAMTHFIGDWAASPSRREGERPLVSVILDDENAWEHYRGTLLFLTNL
jgi:hypothetical protein